MVSNGRSGTGGCEPEGSVGRVIAGLASAGECESFLDPCGDGEDVLGVETRNLLHAILQPSHHSHGQAVRGRKAHDPGTTTTEFRRLPPPTRQSAPNLLPGLLTKLLHAPQRPSSSLVLSSPPPSISYLGSVHCLGHLLPTSLGKSSVLPLISASSSSRSAISMSLTDAARSFSMRS